MIWILVGIVGAIGIVLAGVGIHEAWFRYRMWRSEKKIAAVRQMMRDANERRKGVHP